MSCLSARMAKARCIQLTFRRLLLAGPGDPVGWLARARRYVQVWKDCQLDLDYTPLEQRPTQRTAYAFHTLFYTCIHIQDVHMDLRCADMCECACKHMIAKLTLRLLTSEGNCPFELQTLPRFCAHALAVNVACSPCWLCRCNCSDSVARSFPPCTRI